jgi:UPF0716 protein FxsA
VRGLLLIVGLIVAEVYVFLQAVHHLGVLATLALLLAISASGPWLVRRTGLGVWRRAQSRLQEGEVPGRELVDGVLLFAAGVLLTLPGFITGVIGVLLLLPPVRALVRRLGARSLARRVVVAEWNDRPVPGGGAGSVITTTSRPSGRPPTGRGLAPGPGPGASRTDDRIDGPDGDGPPHTAGGS